MYMQRHLWGHFRHTTLPLGTCAIFGDVPEDARHTTLCSRTSPVAAGFPKMLPDGLGTERDL